MGIRLLACSSSINHGYRQSSCAQERPETKSISGYVFTLAEGAVNWKSQKQSITAQSSPEARYGALSLAVCEALFYENLKVPLGLDPAHLCIYTKIMMDVFKRLKKTS